MESILKSKKYSLSTDFTSLSTSLPRTKYLGDSIPSLLNTVSDGDDFTVILSDDLADWSDIDNIIQSHTGLKDLTEQKAERINEVKAKTEALAATGYTHAGQTFPMDKDARARFMDLNLACEHGYKAFPFYVLNKNGMKYEITNQAGFNSLIQAGFNSYAALVFGSGGEVDLINQIVTAPDKAALDAIIDNRT